MNEPMSQDVTRHVWHAKYCLREDGREERSLDDTWRRVADALARAEPTADRAAWAQRFHALLASGAFLPGGRIIAGAGTGRRVTLFNCFVMGRMEDSIDGILHGLHEGAVTMHQGGGVGYDFSALRPQGAPAHGTGGQASGPVSFMEIWDTTCRTLLSTSARRGAMMATLDCRHPDVETFIDAKRAPGVLTNFNVSVLVSDAFMEAVSAGGEWRLAFPPPGVDPPPGEARIERTIQARDLWNRLMRAAYDSAEPGVLFVDRINAMNNLAYREHITATNPCGEIPLPPYGACNLGSLNLVAFVRRPFDDDACLDHVALAAAATLATRMLDNVVDVSGFPLSQQAEQAHGTRRLGLGVTGLADALLMLGLRYGSEAACEAAAGMMRTVCHAAYRASVALARERGPFPFLEREPYLAAPFVHALPGDVRDGIARHGIRNSHLTAIAPAGTISLLAGGVSSGVEPVFAASYRRQVLDEHGEARAFQVQDPAVRAWRARGESGLPPHFVDINGVAPGEQLATQAALQAHVDSAISKTVTVPAAFEFESFRSVYERAHALGLKGCTVYRPSAVRGSVMDLSEAAAEGPHCCSLERETG